jgi:hypothetical protein
MNVMDLVQRDRQSAPIEGKIILSRRKYMLKVKKFREYARATNHLDKATVNAGHTSTKIWTNQTAKSTRKAFLEGLYTGLNYSI